MLVRFFCLMIDLMPNMDQDYLNRACVISLRVNLTEMGKYIWMKWSLYLMTSWHGMRQECLCMMLHWFTREKFNDMTFCFEWVWIFCNDVEWRGQDSPMLVCCIRMPIWCRWKREKILDIMRIRGRERGGLREVGEGSTGRRRIEKTDEKPSVFV